jgi:starch phosphorylase
MRTINKEKLGLTTRATTPPLEDVRTALSPDALARALVDNLFYIRGKAPEFATQNDWYMALAYTVRDRLLERWVRTIRTIMLKDVKIVSYLSAEFLMGPQLGNNLINLGIYDAVEQAVDKVGLRLADLIEQEEEPGLGNGGLGRLAACFMDSLATLEIPAIGYGIRYEFGIFDQEIRDGWQVEVTDKWLHYGNPWEIPRPEICFHVNLGGRTESYYDQTGRYRVRWIPNRVVNGVAYDTPILGYRVNTTNLLRLWRAEATESFDFEAFNTGDYLGAVNQKVISENITKILYPNDSISQGKQLRLEQQYFFASCSLQDMIRIHLAAGNPLDRFHECFAVQLNDTHPSIGVAELMRLLVDEYLIDWEKAWHITQQTFGYTNHTLLPEALEKWSLPLFASLLPRHLEIIYEINRRFLDQVRARFPGDEQRVARLSLIDESGEKYVRMAHLASVGSHAINGVAALHTELLKRDVLRDFYALYPERFHSITNGVTPRRWIALSNPGLTKLITRLIGDDWVRDADELGQLEMHAHDAGVREEWRRIKRDNKLALAKIIKERTGIVADPDSLFDVQVKRLHEYKRQHLNVLHIITLYQRLKHDPHADVPTRTFIFGGKAAPGYAMAKLIIKLINSVADVVNRDAAVRERLKVVFLPDFNVKNGQWIYPAADLSEQISTAGKEASGTGNMKFAMNGALTIGTLDGANIEIREAVGAENFFLFGLTADEVLELKSRGYDPGAYYRANAHLREAIDLIAAGFFSNGDRAVFKPLVDALLYHDEYMLFADYQSYVERQDEVGRVFGDPERWTQMAIFNVARMGPFSSDRSIREYCRLIWDVTPVRIELS